MAIEEQLRKLEQQLQRIKPERIIHNTDEAIQRMRDVQRAAPWRGREIALGQEEVKL